MISIVFRRAADRLLVVDPGLVRFFTALRAALATLLTAAASIEMALRHASSPAVAGLGVLFSMIAPLFLRDHTLREWVNSLLCLYLAATLSFVAAAALAPTPLIADAVFIALLFAGMLVQACGPRAIGCAIMSLVAFYLGLYLHPPKAELSLMLALSAVAPCVIVFVGRWIVPARHAGALRLAIRTVTLRAHDVLAVAQRAGQHGARTHAALSSMNEAAIAFEERLALLEPVDENTLREALVELEVAAGQYVFDAANRPVSELALRSAIARLEAIDTKVATRARSRSVGNAVSLAATLKRLRVSLSWLPATRTAVAAMLAMIAGHSLSPERWFWAVITTFVVFLGTRSRGDTLYRGAQRIVGTLAGGIVSTLLIACLHGQPVALAAAMLLCVFGWAYFILSAYGPGVFFITMLVCLVYGELGFAVQPLVELRIEEVSIGCLACLVAAFTVKPLYTTRHIETRMAGVIDALIEAVKVAASAGKSADAGSAAVAVRTLDRQWHEFRIALRPQRVFVWESQYENVAGALLCCVHNVRALLCTRNSSHDRSNLSFEPVLVRLEAIRERCTQEAIARTPRDAVVGIAADAPALVALDGAVALLAQRLNEPTHGRALTIVSRNLRHAWRKWANGAHA